MPKKDPSKMSTSELKEWRKEMQNAARAMLGMGLREIADELGCKNYQTIQNIISRGSKRSRYAMALDDWFIRHIEKRLNTKGVDAMCDQMSMMLRNLSEMLANSDIEAKVRLNTFLIHLDAINKMAPAIESNLRRKAHSKQGNGQRE